MRASFDVNDETHFNNLWVLSEDTYENSMRMEFWMIKHVVWTYRTNMIDHCVLNNKRKDYLYLYVVAEFFIKISFSHLYTRMLKHEISSSIRWLDFILFEHIFCIVLMYNKRIRYKFFKKKLRTPSPIHNEGLCDEPSPTGSIAEGVTHALVQCCTTSCVQIMK